jgi:hypothetical protein
MRFLPLASVLALAWTSAALAQASGSISGRITYNGRLPHPRTVLVTQDKKFCGATRMDETWSIAPDGGIRDVVVYLVGVKGGRKLDAEVKPVVDQQGCRYLPHVQVVPLGAVLSVNSSDPVMHNIHFFYNGATAVNFAMPPGSRARARKMDKPGGQQLKCDVHPFMRGGVFVAQDPYYAVTGPDGRYEIKDVPPGIWSIATWHEEGGPTFQPITIPSGGKVEWNSRIR